MAEVDLEATVAATGDAVTVLGGHAPRAREPLQRGACIGRYVVLDHLGAGGMGVVYVAYDPELDRKLAIKLLHGDGDHSRLLREATALARLSHPNVVAVHDVGKHAGQVFLAMELVEGQTLAALLASPPPRPTILALFSAAGQGLAAAHHAGLVHRDFKPENVMVDRHGRARVLDFGLARAADAPDEQQPLVTTTSSLDVRLTATGSVLGTPAYMAPEQHLGQPADARCDQFAFCVALYEALHGERPFAGDDLASLALAVTDGRVREPPRGRKVPAWLRRVLLRGLAVDPAARFPDMDALLAALARDPAQRRRRLARVATLALALLGAGLGGAAWLDARAGVCADSETAAWSAWDAEHRAAAAQAFADAPRSHAVATFTAAAARLDAHVAALAALRRDTCEATQRGHDDLLDRRWRCLDRQVARVRGLVDTWRSADADVVDHAVEAVDNLPPVTQCADPASLRQDLPPPADLATAARVDELRRRLEGVVALRLAGRYVAAREQATRLVALARATGYGPVLAEALLQLGVLGRDTATWHAASTDLADAIWQAEASGHDRVLAEALAHAIYVEGAGRNRHELALALARRAEAVLQRIGGDPRLEVRRLLNLASVHRDAEAVTRARDTARVALDLALATLGPDNLTVADAANQLGAFELILGHDVEAATHLNVALQIWRSQLGEHHPRVGKALANLANLHRNARRLPEAERAAREALAVLEHAVGSDHPDVGATLIALALILDHDGRAAEAVPLLRRALALFEARMGPEHRFVSTTLGNLGHALRQLGEYPEALVVLRRDLALDRTLYGATSETAAWSLDNLSLTLLAAGDIDAAMRGFRESLAIFEKRGSDPESSVLARAGLGRCHLARREYALALEPLERSLADLRNPDDNRDTRGEIALALARTLWALDRDRPRALALARQARDDLGRTPRYYVRELAELDRWLARGAPDPAP